MKKLVRIALVLGIMIVSRTVFAEEGPSVLQTPEKDALITEKTEPRPPQILKKRVEISKDSTITIYYEASSDAQGVPPQTNKPKESTATPYEGDETKAKEIMEKFDSVWRRNLEGQVGHGAYFVQIGLLNEKYTMKEYLEILKQFPNMLTPEELETADSLAEEYMNLYREHPTRIMEDYYLGYLSARGNRYITRLEELFAAIDRLPTSGLYSNYIFQSDNWEARAEDVPTDDDKRLALPKLKEAALRTGVIEFPKKAMEEIYRLDPEAHAEFKKLFQRNNSEPEKSGWRRK